MPISCFGNEAGGGCGLEIDGIHLGAHYNFLPKKYFPNAILGILLLWDFGCSMEFHDEGLIPTIVKKKKNLKHSNLEKLYFLNLTNDISW